MVRMSGRLKGEFKTGKEVRSMDEKSGEKKCVWEGCTASSTKHVSTGWKNIVVTSGSIFKPINFMDVHIDGVLCPEHFEKMRSFLKGGEIKL